MNVKILPCLAVLALSCTAVPFTRATEHQSAISLRCGPYLFLDDFLIESVSNVTRRIVSPARILRDPVVTSHEDHNFQPYMTVLRDTGTQKFRMWYGVPVDAGQSHLACIESPDGIHWIRPHRVLEDPGRITFGASVLDEGPGFPDAARRFKYVWYNGGMMLAHSRDGLHWALERPAPVITGINDIIHLARDTARNRYIAVFGYPSSPADGYHGHTQNSSEGYRRCVGQSTSVDCLAWTTPRRVIAPDAQDEGITEFYSIGGVLTRGDMLIGLLKVLRDDLPCDLRSKVNGIGYTVLAWSHDGEKWERDREPFFDRNPESQTWDHAMAWMDYQLPVADEVFIYYGGYARGHKVERFTERQIGLVRIKTDRYVAREAIGTGTIRTRLLRLGGNDLTLNANAEGGELRAQIIDETGKPLKGFAFKDCMPIKTDALAAPLHWKRPLSEIGPQAVKIEFHLRNAKLFEIDCRH